MKVERADVLGRALSMAAQNTQQTKTNAKNIHTVDIFSKL
jgi:hypothetical protein